MVIVRLSLAFFVAALISGCTSFSTVTISGPRSEIEKQFNTIAVVLRAYGYVPIMGSATIPGYNRYANDPRNRVVRAWQRGEGRPYIHEFWRDDCFVVIIYTRSRLAREYADEIAARIKQHAQNVEVIVSEQQITDFA